MDATSDVNELIERYHQALDEFIKGNPEPVKNLFSHQEDATLANPYGPPVRGWKSVVKTLEHAASQRRDGKILSIEVISKYVTPALAYVVEIERAQARVGNREDITPYALRVTMIFRPEDGAWKVVHRHADPITKAQPVESVL